MKGTAYVLSLFSILLAGAECRRKKLGPGLTVADKQAALAGMTSGDVIVSMSQSVALYCNV